jgi:hypothetical protein
MNDRAQPGRLQLKAPDISLRHPPLPLWLAQRVLHRDERIVWVYGPWHSPNWESVVTHPLLFLAALGTGAVCVLIAVPLNRVWPESMIVAGMVAVALFLAAVFVLGIFSGYFTRLVVTNYRIVILQGREVCRSWRIDQLPRSLVRYAPREGESASRTIDLDALQIMLGGTSDKVADSKTILSFGKHLDHIRAQEDQRP